MATLYTIYELVADDNIQGLAVTDKRELANEITNLLLEKWLDVWYEPNYFGGSPKSMAHKLSHSSDWLGGV